MKPVAPGFVRVVEIALEEAAKEEKLVDEIRRALEEENEPLAMALMRRFVGLPPKEEEPDLATLPPRGPELETGKSYIYIIETTEGPHRIKIGVSRQPGFRLRQLRMIAPVPIRIHSLWLGDYVDEQEVHRQLVEHRLHGEWFDGAALELAEEVLTSMMAELLSTWGEP